MGRLGLLVHGLRVNFRPTKRAADWLMALAFSDDWCNRQPLTQAVRPLCPRSRVRVGKGENMLTKTLRFEDDVIEVLKAMQWSDDGLRGVLVGQLDRKLYERTNKRSEEHTSELQSQSNLVCRLLFLMIRRPPRSTLFPYRRSSDLSNAME